MSIDSLETKAAIDVVISKHSESDETRELIQYVIDKYSKKSNGLVAALTSIRTSLDVLKDALSRSESADDLNDHQKEVIMNCIAKLAITSIGVNSFYMRFYQNDEQLLEVTKELSWVVNLASYIEGGSSYAGQVS